MGGGRALIVLDTHVALWVDLQPDKLGRKAGTRLRRELKRGGVAISAVSFFEIGLLLRHGRVRLGTSLEGWREEVLAQGIREIALTGGLGILASGIGQIPDPADRLIMATAIHEGASLSTADQTILKWEGDLQRLDASR